MQLHAQVVVQTTALHVMKLKLVRAVVKVFVAVKICVNLVCVKSAKIIQCVQHAASAPVQKKKKLQNKQKQEVFCANMFSPFPINPNKINYLLKD